MLEIDPDRVRVVRPDSLGSLPGNSPVGSRMAVMMGGAAANACKDIKRQMIAIAAQLLGQDADCLRYAEGRVIAPDGQEIGWAEIVDVTHRRFHVLPPGTNPGLTASFIQQVPTGVALPIDDKVQMYPC